MVTGGRNTGRVGVIKNREKPKGSFESIHIQDATGHEFATCMVNVFTIGKGTKPWVSLPKGGKGIKLTIIEEARKRLAAAGRASASAIDEKTTMAAVAMLKRCLLRNSRPFYALSPSPSPPIRGSLSRFVSRLFWVPMSSGIRLALMIPYPGSCLSVSVSTSVGPDH
ncbi:hypothetical protein B296_00007894 [Ensete ventricosum]|uniref:Small ribosomal subunit protein eS4 C-terminal domain-containing protein n=1 Tax=Ensete ventricosum TaxID=4639 RepID=A0A427AYV1_ENSVE|nr:hypothetical protein B296_00007894 [Ensete ventricosum]